MLSKKLELAEKRIEDLEAELQSAQHFIGEARARLNEYEETSRFDQSRLEAAEKRMCELEMRARTAEGQAKDNSNTLVRIEEAIRTQILSKRLSTNKLTSS
jgi:DNA repair ATPase RecN